jgi:vacuolar protein sorting-associated protein 54
VEGVDYKVVWSCLLLVEMIMTNLSSAAHFQSLAPNAVTKVVELLRLFNARTTTLVLGAGAIHSAARLKSINAKHLSYVTQCLGMTMALLPHIRAALMAQLPPKQHSLLADLDKIKKEFQDHNEKVLNKFVSIIGGIVEHGLAPRIANTDFDARARDLPYEKLEEIQCCVFLEGISNSTTKLHQVLSSLLPPDHLQDVFSRIFAYLDQKSPALFIAASATANPQNASPSFQFPSTDDGKRRMVLEVSQTTKCLNALVGVHPWDFTAMTVLERKMDYKLPDETIGNGTTSDEPQQNPETPDVDKGTEENETIATVDRSEGDINRNCTENGDETATNDEVKENGEAPRKAEAPIAAIDDSPSTTANTNGESSQHGKEVETPVSSANGEDHSS